MIGSLRGKLVDSVLRSDYQAELLVEAGGVGYRVLVPALSASRTEIGAETFWWVHTHVREDALVLYGFSSRDERECFELLLGAHGVGPSLAASLLCVLPPSALRRAVLAGDAETLATVPGIGKKTAQRLLLELAPRFEAAQTGPDAPGVQASASGGGSPPAVAAQTQREQVRAALASLGYGADEVRSVLARLGPDEPAEDMLRRALQELAATG